MIHPFTEVQPSVESYWRSIILFGRNVASYKFALGKSLLTLAAAHRSFVALDELAKIYATYLCEHLTTVDKQGTFQSSAFLDACRGYNRGAIHREELVATTVRLGFNNVLDAFHVVNRKTIPVRFFEVTSRHKAKGLVLTDDLLTLTERRQFENLPHEVESRWNLVETSWQLGISRHLLDISHDEGSSQLVVSRDHERVPVTSSRSALAGYQKGHCFYCFDTISVEPGSPALADVDHFFPFALEELVGTPFNLHGIWNLVLACKSCNRGVDGKFERVPHLRYLERLHKRNEFFIHSHHPLRQTMLRQTGMTKGDRHRFLQNVYSLAKSTLLFNWESEQKGAEMF